MISLNVRLLKTDPKKMKVRETNMIVKMNNCVIQNNDEVIDFDQIHEGDYITNIKTDKVDIKGAIKVNVVKDDEMFISIPGAEKVVIPASDHPYICNSQHDIPLYKTQSKLDSTDDPNRSKNKTKTIRIISKIKESLKIDSTNETKKNDKLPDDNKNNILELKPTETNTDEKDTDTEYNTLVAPLGKLLKFVTTKIIYDPSRLLGGDEWIFQDKSIKTEYVDNLMAVYFIKDLCNIAVDVTIENDIMNIKIPGKPFFENQATILPMQLIVLSQLEFYVIKPNKLLDRVRECTHVRVEFMEQYIDKDSHTLQFKVLEMKTSKEFVPYCHKWLISHRRAFETTQNLIRTGYMEI